MHDLLRGIQPGASRPSARTAKAATGSPQIRRALIAVLVACACAVVVAGPTGA